MTSVALSPHAMSRNDAADRGEVMHRYRIALGMLLTGAVVFINESVFRRTNVEQFAFDWQIALRLALCGCCGLYGLAHRQHQALWQEFPAVLAAAFVAWTLVTVPFAVSLNYAAASSLSLVCFALFAPAVVAELGGRRFVKSVFSGLLLYNVGSWLLYMLGADANAIEVDLPGVEYVARMGGLNSSNSTGRQAAALWGMTLALWVARTVPLRLLLVSGALALATLKATDSRTAMLAAAAATSVVIAERLGRRNALALAVLAALAAAVGMLLLSNGPPGVTTDDFFSKFSRSGEADEIYHMTGRVELWEFVVACIRSSPVFGYGWGCTRFLLIDGHFATHHAHNLILNVTLGGGVLAGALVASTLVGLIGRGLREPNLFPDVVTALVCVGGMADAVMLNPVPDSHTLMWMAALHWRSLGASLRYDELSGVTALAGPSVDATTDPSPAAAENVAPSAQDQVSAQGEVGE